MDDKLPNLYAVPSLPGLDSQAQRVIQDLAARVNYLTEELDRVRGLVMSASPGVDAARKERPTQGIITIPCRNDGGQDGQVRVSKDGVIVSYVNPAESIFPYVDVSTAGVSGAGSTTLHSFTLPAGVLMEDGDYLTVYYSGRIVNNDNDKRVQGRFDGTVYETMGLADIDGGGNTGWMMLNRIFRTSSTSVTIVDLLAMGALLIDSANAVNSFAASWFSTVRNQNVNCVNLNTTSLVMDVTGQGGANNDITQNFSEIIYGKPRTRKLV